MEKFKKEFQISKFVEPEFDVKLKESAQIITQRYSRIKDLIEQFGGYAFDKGLYRIHTYSSSLFWTDIITKFYKQYEGKVYCFGYDWLGRQFAIHTQLENYTFMFDPSTAEAFTLNCNLFDFHNIELVDYKAESLLTKEFNLFFSRNPKELAFKECVGFKIPLFLGGKDSVDNYEITDMEVYVEMNFQLYNQTKNLPDKTHINKITKSE